MEGGRQAGMRLAALETGDNERQQRSHTQVCPGGGPRPLRRAPGQSGREGEGEGEGVRAKRRGRAGRPAGGRDPAGGRARGRGFPRRPRPRSSLRRSGSAPASKRRPGVEREPVPRLRPGAGGAKGAERGAPPSTHTYTLPSPPLPPLLRPRAVLATSPTTRRARALPLAAQSSGIPPRS